MFRESHQKNQVRPKEAKFAAVHDQSASFPNLIGARLEYGWRQSENCVVLFGGKNTMELRFDE